MIGDRYRRQTRSWRPHIPVELKGNGRLRAIRRDEPGVCVDLCSLWMLRMALEVPWYLRVTNSEVYGRLSRVTETIRGRRLRLAGHVEELIVRDLLFWDPTHGSRGRGRPRTTYVDVLRRDTGLESLAEIQRLMQDRVLWRQFIMSRMLKPP